MMNKKALVMYSGGADSTLALQMMLDQGVECVALNVKTPFCSCSHGGCAGAVGDIILDNEISVKTRFLGEAYMKMLINPKYGYGRGINPCSDCRIMMLQAAREVMAEEDAAFVVTGEVVGQRPNSQMYRQMQNIERDSGLTGRLLRPLSAKLLPPTIPELHGLVDRNKLLALQGRSRSPQIELAKELDTGPLPNSGGGCVLTEPRYADKVRDLYEHTKGIPDIEEADLLRVGRQFRFGPEFKIIVGRDEGENETLERLFAPGDLLFIPTEENLGASALVRGDVTETDYQRIAALALRYAKVTGATGSMEILSTDAEPQLVTAEPMDKNEVKRYII
jgi:hypothetical protein